MGKLNLNSKDVLLLLLYASTKKPEHKNISGRTRIIKLMFIFQKEVFTKFKNDDTTLEEINFDAWNYGPWSKNIYDDIEFLSNVGFIDSEISNEEPAYSEAEEFDKWENGLRDDDEVDVYAQEEFSLTPLGTSYVEAKLWPSLSQGQRVVLSNFKDKLNSVPLYALLKYVYTRYPETTTNSTIKDKVLAQK